MDIIDDGSCFACGHHNESGLKLQFDIDAVAMTASTTFTIPSSFSGWKNAAHGGIVSTILDEVMVYACGSVGWLVATGRLAVRFRKPVPVETPLLLTGQVVKHRGRLGIQYDCHCPNWKRIRQADGNELNTKLAQGLKFLSFLSRNSIILDVADSKFRQSAVHGPSERFIYGRAIESVVPVDFSEHDCAVFGRPAYWADLVHRPR